MKRILSSIIYAGLMLALAAAAYLAFPGRADIAAQPDPIVDAGSAPAAQAQSPAAAINWTNISVPLSTSVTTADGLAAYIDPVGNSIIRVGRWDAATQSLVIRNVGSPFGQPNFNISIGQWLFIGANSSAPTTMTWVGDVPGEGSITYTLKANGWTGIMLPLDQGSITTADALGSAIGSVTRVARWDANSQSLVIRNVGSPFGQPNFAIQIGYPYFVYSTSQVNWP